MKHQKAIANYLGMKINTLPISLRKLFLLVLLMVIGGFCFWSIVVAVNMGHPVGLTIDRIAMPTDIRMDRSTPDPASTAPEIQRILFFKQLLDSLHGDEMGRKRYDSILFHRPGLLDSMDIILNN